MLATLSQCLIELKATFFTNGYPLSNARLADYLASSDLLNGYTSSIKPIKLYYEEPETVWIVAHGVPKIFQPND